MRFEGFAAEELADDVRIVPEEGLALFAPTVGVIITPVDGLWWRGERCWYKIPDHCAATITSTPNGPRFEHDCDAIGVRIQRMRGALTAPAWVPDSGATGHPSDYPFEAR